MEKHEMIKYEKFVSISMPKHRKIHIYTDGGCRGNPGPGAIGIVIFDTNGNIIVEHKECIGETTNNRAEYSAVIRALEIASGLCRNEITCFLDSQLAVKQITGKWAIKKRELLELFHILKDRERAFVKVTYNHRKRTHRHIQKADKLVGEALDNNNY